METLINFILTSFIHSADRGSQLDSLDASTAEGKANSEKVLNFDQGFVESRKSSNKDPSNNQQNDIDKKNNSNQWQLTLQLFKPSMPIYFESFYHYFLSGTYI